MEGLPPQPLNISFYVNEQSTKNTSHPYVIIKFTKKKNKITV